MEKRKAHKQELINALTEAQKLAFAPLSFHAIAAMIEFGILKEIDTKPKPLEELIQKSDYSEYTITTLLEVSELIGIVKQKEGIFNITPMGRAFLYDEMTRVNFNFVKDVCYSGASELANSFKSSSPKGFQQLKQDAKTIYPYLSELPTKMRKSWYEFDHYYSDNCFDIIFEILDTDKKIFDIGGNTGKFEKVCLKKNSNIDITMLDLPKNIDVVKEDEELLGCKFIATDILDEESPIPQFSGSVIMSQFLDCFSKSQIEYILRRVAKNSDFGTKIYILEPFIDRQKFEGAKHSLVHTSLYFTCMANGCSKMYSMNEMKEIIERAGLKVNQVYDALGAHDYTLLECVHA